MSKYIDLELALNELLRLYEEDVDRYAVEIRCGIKIPETFDYHRAKEALQSLPTIEVSEEELKGCDKVDKRFSEDCVSREQAIEILCRSRCGERARGCPAHSCPIIEKYDNLPSVAPSVVPSRADGEAIDRYDDEGWTCSICGKGLYAPDDKYCPNCGASMKGARNEESV